MPPAILIIDDNEEDHVTLKRYLSGAPCPGSPYRILDAFTGSDGLAIAAAEPPDCILLDFSLPDMDGIELLRALAKQVPPEQLCVLVLTGSGNEAIAVQSLKSGASDYLMKGKFSRDTLCHAVAGALEKKQFRMELTRQQALLREQNEQLAVAKDALERSNADLEQFAYAASHDLQEPLRAIDGFTKLLRAKYKNQLDAEAHEYLQFMTTAASRMGLLIQNLLDYSRVNTQQTALQPVDLNHVLDQVKANLQRRINEASAHIHQEPLPVVMANEWHMVQLFQNLMSNALKFRSDQPMKITVSAQYESPYWCVSVQDTGIGMDMQYARHIFQAFKRLHTRDQYEGSGIGLATCQKIVERYGGKIWVESKIGEGSTFYFTLMEAEKPA